MKEELIAVLRAILAANDDFRRSMPEDWEGDPMQDACDEARKVLTRAESAARDARLASYTAEHPKPLFRTKAELARALANNTLKALMLLATVEAALELDLVELGPTSDLLRKRAQEFRAEIAD